MQAKVFCKTVAKGIQAYYVSVDGNSIYLFQQNYRVSNKEFFSNGVVVHALGKFRNVHSTSVRNTLEKIPSYLRYVEKEYGVEIYEKTKRRKQGYNVYYDSKKKGFKEPDDYDIA